MKAWKLVPGLIGMTVIVAACGTIDTVKSIGGETVKFVSAANDKDLHAQADQMYAATDRANAAVAASAVTLLQAVLPGAHANDLATQLDVSNALTDLGDRNVARARVVEGVQAALGTENAASDVRRNVQSADFAKRAAIFKALEEHIAACQDASKTFDESKPVFKKVNETSHDNSATAYFIKPGTWIAEVNSTINIGDQGYGIAHSVYVLIKLANVDPPMAEPPENGGFRDWQKKFTEESMQALH